MRAGARASAQLKSLLAMLNRYFGFTTKPLSMLMALNIEFGFAVQLKSVFIAVNLDFGCAARRPFEGPRHRRRASPRPRCGGALLDLVDDHEARETCEGQVGVGRGERPGERGLADLAGAEEPLRPGSAPRGEKGLLRGGYGSCP